MHKNSRVKSDNDLISVSLAAGKRKPYKYIKTQQAKKDLMQDSPRGQILERRYDMNREMRWCQIAGNASTDAYECLLRLCDAKMPFAYKGHFCISHNGL